MSCLCCGRFGADVKVGGGAMHFNCWNEHHSDPNTEWPVGHICVERAS